MKNFIKYFWVLELLNSILFKSLFAQCYNLYHASANSIWHWASPLVTYYVNVNGSRFFSSPHNTEANAIDRAFTAWQNVEPASISFNDGGFDNATFGNDSKSVLYWDNNENLSPYVVASLTPWGNTSTGVLTNVDIWFNDRYYQWTDGTLVFDSNIMDIQSIATHEIGHLVGLYESDPCIDNAPTMMTEGLWITYYKSEAESPTLGIRSLAQGDKDGLNYLYGSTLHVPEVFSSIAEAIGFAQSGQTISVNSGTYTLSSSITVQNGVTLTIEAGTNLYFASGTSLTVNGTLNAVGNSSTGITFNRSGSTGTWGGIQFNSGSRGNISYSTITNTSYGIYAYETNSLSISNTEIYNCSSHGIYVYRTNYTNQPSISNCTIHNNSNSTGIVMYWSSPDITGCNVYSNYNGLGIADYSSPRLGYTSVYGNNNVHNNSNIGVYSLRYSSPLLGINSFPFQGGNNIIASNTFRDAQAETYCTVNAENNWWGSNPPDPNKIVALSGSTIDYDPYLTSQPNPSRIYNDPITLQNGSLEKTVIPGNSDSYNPKINLSYSSAIGEDPDPAFEIYELNKKWNQANGNDLNTFKSYLKELANKKDKKMLYAAAKLILAGYEKEKRIQMIDEVVTDYDGSPIIQTALMSKFLYYFNEMKDYQSADKIMQEIGLKFPGSSLVEETKKHFELLNSSQQQNSNNADLLNQKNVSTKADGYLLDNYPNPFNPTTKISFSLPFKSQVKLKVFDVLGREIQILADGVYEAGKYEVEFNATNLPSGVYFYNLSTGSTSITKKMLVLR